MKCNTPSLAAACKGLCRLGHLPLNRSGARWMGVVLVVALFGVDTFQPIIGLVEVSRASRKGNEAGTATPDAEAAEASQPVVVSIQAWSWHQPPAELWPAFVFQPTISAGSGGSAQSARSIAPSGGTAAAAPSWPAWSRPAPQMLGWLAAPLDGCLLSLRLTWCREICPIGPPVA